MMAQVQKFVKNQKFAQSELQQYLDGENLNTPILNQYGSVKKFIR
ncbi:hypothetical protein [Nostoc sp.]